MTDTHCLQCGSVRVRRSRRHSPLEFAIAVAGWRVRRCHDCKTRFFQFGASLVRADGIKKLGNALLFAALAVAAVGIVIPESIAPPAPDEVILHTDGGEMVVNGVTVRQEGGPQLKKGMEYMLVLQLQSNGKVAVPAAGEAGVFEAEAGAQLKPIVASNLADNLRERGMIMVQALRIWLRHRML